MIAACKVLLALTLLAWLTNSGRVDLEPFQKLTFDSVTLLTFAIVGVSIFLPALRWWWLLAQSIDVSFSLAVRLTWIGYFSTLFLPGAAAGDIAKGAILLRGGNVGALAAFGSVFVDRLLGLYSLLLVGAAAAGLMELSGGTPASLRSTSLIVALCWVVGTAGIGLVANDRSWIRYFPPQPYREWIREPDQRLTS